MTPTIEDQIKFVEQRIEIWKGHSKLHEEMRAMYIALLESLRDYQASLKLLS